MATEIALLKLKPDTDLTDGGSARKILEDGIATILAQPGAQRVYWGVAVEDPQLIRFFVDWDSVESHKTFQALDSYKDFVAHFRLILDSIIALYHANMTPHPPVAAMSKARSPATELLTVFFPSDYTAAQQAKFSADFEKLADALQKHGHPDSYTTSAGGWVVEDEIVSPANPDHKGKAFFAAIGWQSVQHHLDFRGTDAFKENIHLLRGADGLIGLHVQHFVGEVVERE